MTPLDFSSPEDYEKPYLEGYSGDQLDPGGFPAGGVTLVAPPSGLAAREYVYFYLGKVLLDWTRVPASGPGGGVTVDVAKEAFMAQQGQVVEVYYQVASTADGARTDSQKWLLTLGSTFEGEVLLDLSPHNYIVSADKPPLEYPSFAQLLREANGGAAPYRYQSSDLKVATVDTKGLVTALANGLCEITATDSEQRVLRYTLTVSGVRRLHFLTSEADWAGMKKACEEARLGPVTLSQIKRMWSLYYSNTGPVCDYLGYLSYAFWTADALGAGTAWAYDLNGANLDANASSVDEREYRQVLGIELG